MSEELILSIAIFSHGCENLLEPFSGSNDVGNFYKNNVRVYSQSCVPDLPSVTLDAEHIPLARDLVKQFQIHDDTDTMSILRPLTSQHKTAYVSRLTTTKRNDFDPRIYEETHMNKTCGEMVFLSNKEFTFEETKMNGEKTNGIFLLDIRKRLGFDDYETLFKVSETYRNRYIPNNLTTKDGLTYLLKNVLKKSKKEIDEISRMMGFTKSKTSINKIDLEQLYILFMSCNIDYVNIMDYSCRVNASRRLNADEIETIRHEESEMVKKVTAFGLRKKRTSRKQNKMIKKKSIKKRK
jgi:hypothetical protein